MKPTYLLLALIAFASLMAFAIVIDGQNEAFIASNAKRAAPYTVENGIPVYHFTVSAKRL